MLQALIEFGVYCLYFSFRGSLAETRTDKELSQTIKAFLKSLVRAVKVVISVG